VKASVATEPFTQYGLAKRPHLFILSIISECLSAMNKKYNIGVIAIMTLIALGTTTLAILVTEPAYGIRVEGGSFGVVQKKGEPAKIATSGDNVYIAWGTNNTAHPDIMFRASTDSGKTFGEKINLSNTR
jgi:hypothetical protein